MLAAFGVLLGLGASQAVACEATEEIGIAIDCRAYCNKAAECDSGVDEEECRDECTDTLDSCMDDEREDAQDQLDMCSESTCDEFTGCTIEVGAECFFGLG